MVATAERLTPTEKHLVCGTGALAYGTLAKVLRGEPVRPVVLYRLKAALVVLKLDDRFPELFKGGLGGAPDPHPGEIIEPEDAEDDASTRAAE